MRVTQGWSGEVETSRWAKFSVSVDETDLNRMIVEARVIKNETIAFTDELLRSLPVSLVFQLLAAEAEKCVLAKLTTSYGMSKEKTVARISQLHKTQADLMAKVAEAMATV